MGVVIGLGVVFGPSMSGKTFFVLDMGCAIARGLDLRLAHVVHAERHLALEVAVVHVVKIEEAQRPHARGDGVAGAAWST